jgi:hypothetical protein
MVVLYLHVFEFGWWKNGKILTGDGSPEALLVPGKAFKVG